MKRRRPTRSTTPGSAGNELPMGKLPAPLLARMLESTVLVDPTVRQGPAIGADAALVAPVPGDTLAITSDPITFTSDAIGHHLLAVNVNDIVTTGGCPRWLVLTLLLPCGTTEIDVERLFESIAKACQEFEITLVGGHTEITDAVTRPVAVGTLVGAVKRDRQVDPSRSRAGDRILQIGAVAIEGTAILARERASEIDKACGQKTRKRAEGLREKPGICIRDAAYLAVRRYLAHALHDPTEGGVATALRELGELTRCGVDVDVGAIEVHPDTQVICELLGVDPYGLLASGSLLVVAPEDEARRLAAAAKDALGLPSAVIGTLTDEPGEYRWRDAHGVKTPIPIFARDELARVLEREPAPRKAPKKAPPKATPKAGPTAGEPPRG